VLSAIFLSFRFVTFVEVASADLIRIALGTAVSRVLVDSFTLTPVLLVICELTGGRVAKNYREVGAIPICTLPEDAP
jgi:hypothetical protein